MFEVSVLAEAIVSVSLERIWTRLTLEDELFWGPEDPSKHFCIIALGKLGGQELNYSSDIDLLGICDSHQFKMLDTGSGGAGVDIFVTVMKQLRSIISDHTEEGYTYRVDLRLRPYGDVGRLVYTVDQLVNYYQKSASLWEIQALLKARPIAGNVHVGYLFLGRIRPLLLKRFDYRNVGRTIDKMREAVMKTKLLSGQINTDVKNGIGGIRDAEFLVQGLQLIHASEHPHILGANTLNGIKELARADVFPREVADQLIDDYIFLRKVEHYLQILRDQQVHLLPEDKVELDALAKRMLGINSDADQFIKKLNACRERVRKAYVTFLIEPTERRPSPI